jgi:amino acid permease
LKKSDTKRTAELGPSIFNLTKTAIGMGMLAIPFAYKSLGLVLGVIVTCFAMVLGCLSLHFLARVSELKQCFTYPGNEHP